MGRHHREGAPAPETRKRGLSPRRRPRVWRYCVVDVWGALEGQLVPGTATLDVWRGRGEREFPVYGVSRRGELEAVGGWSARLVGEVTDAATLERFWAEWDRLHARQRGR